VCGCGSGELGGGELGGELGELGELGGELGAAERRGPVVLGGRHQAAVMAEWGVLFGPGRAGAGNN
jgi:hypothetical protein